LQVKMIAVHRRLKGSLSRRERVRVAAAKISVEADALVSVRADPQVRRRARGLQVLHEVRLRLVVLGLSAKRAAEKTSRRRLGLAAELFHMPLEEKLRLVDTPDVSERADHDGNIDRSDDGARFVDRPPENARVVSRIEDFR